MPINLKVNLDDKEAKEKLKQLQEGKYNIDVDVNGDKINETAKSMNNLTSATKSTNTVFGKLRNTIIDTFSAGKLAMTGYLAVLNEIRKASKNASQVIEDVDKAITDLSIASGMTREATAGLVEDYNDYAKELKSTTTQVTTAADDYLRAGKTMVEAKDLISDSIMLSKLGQIDSSQATEDLLATMNGYNMNVEEVGKALDAMVAIDFQAATSSGDLATGLKYSASSAASAGVSFNKLVAILGTVQDRTQQTAQVIGTFANTVLSRYRDITIGKYLSDDGEDISNYESVLKSVGIQLRDQQGEFRDFETVLQEMADKWDGLTSVQQNSLIKVAAGTRQANRFIALIENYNKVLELTEVAANSAGTAVDKFNNSYANSLEAKQNVLQASFESMIVNSDFDEVYAGIVEATTALVKFVDESNALKGALTGLMAFSGIKLFMSIKAGASEAYIELNKFKNAVDIVGKTKISTTEFNKLLLLSEGLSKKQMKLILSTNALAVAQKKQLLIASGLSEAETTATLQTWKMTVANTGLTASTTSASNALRGLFLTLKANPLVLIVSVIAKGISEWQKYKQSIEEAVQSASEMASTYESQSKTIEEQTKKYQELRSQLMAAQGDEAKISSIKEELLALQKELNEQFGEEYGKLNLVSDAYRDQTEAIKKYNKEAANKFLNKNRKGIEKATDKMTVTSIYSLGSMNGVVASDEMEILDQIKKIASSYNIDFGNNQANDFEFIGNAEDASEAINAFMNELKDLREQSGDTSDVLNNIFDGLLDASGKALTSADEIIDEYQKIYTEAQLAEIAVSAKLSPTYNELTDAIETYNETMSKSENPYGDENVKRAYDNLQRIKQELEDDAAWDAYRRIIDRTFAEADTASYSFYEAMQRNEDGINDLVQSLKGVSETDIQAMVDDGYNGDTFDVLSEKADKYGVSVTDLISLLERLNVIQAMTNSLAEMSKETALSDISSLADPFKDIDLESKVASIQSAYDTLTKAMQEYDEQGYYNMDTIDSLLALDDEYINALFNENGQIEWNAETFRKLAEIKLEEAKASVYQEAMTRMSEAAQMDAQNAANELAKANGTLSDSAYNAAKAMYTEYLANQELNGKSKQLISNIWENTQKKIAMLDSQVKKVTSSTYNFAKASKSAADSTKDATDNIKDQIEAYMSYQQTSLESGKIDYNTYCNTVKNYLTNMYRSGKIAAEDYHTYIGKMLDNQLKVYDSALKAILSRIQKEIDTWQKKIDELKDANEKLTDEQEVYNKALSYAQDLIQKQIDGYDDLIDKIDESSDKLNQQKDDLDGILSAIYKVYDDRIDDLNKQSDAIQEQIDLLNDENSALDLQYRKQQALAALDKAKQQRTKKIYSEEKGFFYTQDEDDIREKEKNLQDIQNEELIASLNKEKDALADSVKELEKYKDLWSEISDFYKNEANKNLLIGLFGDDYEDKVLENNISDIEDFKKNYLDIQQKLNDNEELKKSYEEKKKYYDDLKNKWGDLSNAASDEEKRQAAIKAWGAEFEKTIMEGRESDLADFRDKYLAIQNQINSNEELIKSFEEKKSYYEQLKEQWNSISSAYENAVNEQYATQLMGANWEKDVLSGRLDILEDFKKKYIDIQQAIADAAREAAKAQYEAAQAVGSAQVPSTGTGNGAGDTKQQQYKAYIGEEPIGTYNSKEEAEQAVEAVIEQRSDYSAKKAVEKLTDKRNANQVYENTKSGIGSDLIHKVRIEKFHTGLLNGIVGESSKKNDFEFLKQYGLKKVEIPAILKKGEAVLTEEQIKNLAYNLRNSGVQQNMMKTPNYSKMANSISTNTVQQPITISMGEIHLHEVQNVDSFADAIMKYLPGRMLQAINKR